MKLTKANGIVEESGRDKKFVIPLFTFILDFM
jgi:hypothetical protein